MQEFRADRLPYSLPKQKIIADESACDEMSHYGLCFRFSANLFFILAFSCSVLFSSVLLFLSFLLFFHFLSLHIYLSLLFI